MRLRETAANNDRRLALMAGSELMQRLEEFALAFYSDEVTMDTYMYEGMTYSDIRTINRALTDLQSSTEAIFE